MSKKLLLLAAGATAGLVTFGALFATVFSGGLSVDAQLNLAMRILDEDDSSRGPVALEIAERVKGRIVPEENAKWQYVIGVGNLKSIEQQIASPRVHDKLLIVIEHLSKAQEIGFPAGYLGKGSFYLGKSYYNVNEFEKATKQLKATPTLWPAKRSSAMHLIVNSQLRSTPPDFPGAQQTLEDWEAIPGLAASEQARIAMATAQLALLQDRFDDAKRELDAIAEDLPEYAESLLWQARWRLKKVDEAGIDAAERDKLLKEARELLRKIPATMTASHSISRQGTFLGGLVRIAEGNLNGALSKFNSIRQTDPQSSVAVASGLHETEILFRLGDYDQTLHACRSFLKNAGKLSHYNGRFISLAELKGRVLGMGRSLQDVGEYANAVALADSVANAFGLADSLRLKGEIYETWGREMQAGFLGPTKTLLNHKERVQVNQKFQAAGEAYDRLARLELRSPEYTEILWKAVQNYQAANNLNRANQLLEDYIRYEDRTKSPRAFLAMGRNKMNEGDWAGAIVPFRRCIIEHRKHPVTSEARLLAAQSYYELNQPDEAIKLLNENIYGDSQLKPTNAVWRNSLIELGRIVFSEGDRLILEVQLDPYGNWDDQKMKLDESQKLLSQAIDLLGEAFTRLKADGDNRQYESHYLYARAHELAAEIPLRYVESNPNMIESARRKHVRTRNAYLEKAALQFNALHEQITAETDTLEMNEKTQAIVRNCYFGEANAYFDLEKWDQAITAYMNVTGLFINKPEQLEALVQMAHCYRNLGNIKEAARTLNTAEQVLGRIPPELDGHFVSVTRGDRAEWKSIISRMQKSWN